jgi:hypothetical protein
MAINRLKRLEIFDWKLYVNSLQGTVSYGPTLCYSLRMMVTQIIKRISHTITHQMPLQWQTMFVEEDDTIGARTACRS